MTFWQKIKQSMASFMVGRHGPDNLSTFTLITGLVFTILGNFLPFFSFFGMILYILTLFRMFSRNHDKRTAENRKYIELTSGWKTKIRQFFRRIKNSRDYKFFRCPNCKILLRAKRGSGEREINCVRCGFQFKKKC